MMTPCPAKLKRRAVPGQFRPAEPTRVAGDPDHRSPGGMLPLTTLPGSISAPAPISAPGASSVRVRTRARAPIRSSPTTSSSLSSHQPCASTSGSSVPPSPIETRLATGGRVLRRAPAPTPGDQAACSECQEPAPSKRPGYCSPTGGGVELVACVAAESEDQYHRSAGIGRSVANRIRSGVVCRWGHLTDERQGSRACRSVGRRRSAAVVLRPGQNRGHTRSGTPFGCVLFVGVSRGTPLFRLRRCRRLDE
jgi:hypothetical protein